MPESVAGADAGAHFETFGLALDQRIGAGTYFGAIAQILNSQIDRTTGAFVQFAKFQPAVPGDIPEELNYEERSISLSLNQLLADKWSFGATYRLIHAQLTDDFVNVPSAIVLDNGFVKRKDEESLLHQLSLDAFYNHPSGLFARLQGLWSMQSNWGYSPKEPGSDFWQINAYVGYRFARRRAELTLGLLNLTDKDYRLEPLTLYTELPRQRTFVARFQFSF